MDFKPEPDSEDGKVAAQLKHERKDTMKKQNSEEIFNQLEEMSLIEIFTFLAKEYTWKIWKVNLLKIARDVGKTKYALLWILIIIK